IQKASWWSSSFPPELSTAIRPSSFTLSDNANEGKWVVTAKFDHRPQNTFRAPFEVKKYVLPAFNVTLVPRSAYLSLEDTQLEVELNGGVVTLLMEEIRSVYPGLSSLVGSSVYVKASVLTKSGSDLVEAVKTGIRILHCPYILTFSDMPKYFLPGHPLDLTVPVKVDLLDEEVLTDDAGTLRVIVPMAKTTEAQTITVVTVDGALGAGQQARLQATVLPYTPFNPRQPNFLDVSVLSKGRILQAKRLSVASHASQMVALQVTGDMKPSFRVVAFYTLPWHRGDEVVSDSVWVDLDDGCVGGIWSTVEKGDMGCTRGGGKDGLSVFTDAGLLFISSLGATTKTRQALKCPVSARRRRSAELLKRRAQLGEDGLRDVAMPYSCTRRSLYITEGWECVRAFRHCCGNLRGQAVDPHRPTTPPPPPPPTTTATTTPPPPPPTWPFNPWGTRICFCVAKPYNVKARKNFFVDLKLPQSVARLEQIQIKAVTRGICSVAFGEDHTQEVDLPAGGSVVVTYTLVPLVVGKLPVQVVVLGRGLAAGADNVRKMLWVVLEGVQKTLVRSFVLNPSAHSGIQNITLHPVKLESVVPNSDPLTLINVRGNMLADTIDNSISDDSLASLIRMPGGCVEQNLASMTLPLIVSLYLDRTHGWEAVGVQRKAEALTYITRVPPHSSHTQDQWLGKHRPPPNRCPPTPACPYPRITAFVVKVFSLAYSLVGVEEEQVCGAVRYLLKHKQHGGVFREDNPVYSTTMTGGSRGAEGQKTLTAFVLIALAEARKAGIDCEGL
ncbi:hypothetical protein CRUP_009086, partial [Coryphaenoides rupestris]